MKNEMYIILTLIPLLAGCGDKKEEARSDARSGNKRSQSSGERHHTD